MVPRWLLALYLRAVRGRITGELVVRFVKGTPIKWELSEGGKPDEVNTSTEEDVQTA